MFLDGFVNSTPVKNSQQFGYLHWEFNWFFVILSIVIQGDKHVFRRILTPRLRSLD